jgi:hypothetical protein
MVTAIVISAVLLFLGIGILISIHLCIVVRAISRSLNSRRPAERGVSSSSVSGNGGGMSQEEVQKLPSFEYKHGGMYLALDSMLCKDDDNNDARIENGLWMHEFDCSECAVCLDGFQRGEKCRLLPVCRHTFHAECVDSWLYENPLCPICRTSAQQHDGERGTVVLENVLELAQVGGCEMGNGTRDIAIGVAVREGWRSGFPQSEMSNLVSNPPPSPRSLPTDEFVCNLMSTASLPSNDDDGGGGVTAIDVLSLNQSQSHNSQNQNQNQNSCNLISTPIPSCRADNGDGSRGVGILSSSQSQNQNQNSCDWMSIPVSSCRPPDDDGVRVNGISIASQSQNENQIVYDSTLSLLPHCRPTDDEGLRVIWFTCADENRIQTQTPDGDAMA